MQSTQKDKCQQTIEVIIDGQIDDACQSHLSACESCRQITANVSALTYLSSSYDDSEHLNLKKRVINRLAPLIKNGPATVPAKNSSSWYRWLISLSLAGSLAIMLMISNQPAPVEPGAANRPPIIAVAESQTFSMSINGKASATISMDSPVSLFNNENALIKLADDSEIMVEGPSRLTIKPRGFHLLAGKATATVEPGKTSFVATTIHGRVEVLGTIFTCETSPRTTIVSVKRGRVKVVANDGNEKILGAGESSHLTSENDVGSKTEGIPKISQE